MTNNVVCVKLVLCQLCKLCHFPSIAGRSSSFLGSRKPCKTESPDTSTVPAQADSLASGEGDELSKATAMPSRLLTENVSDSLPIRVRVCMRACVCVCVYVLLFLSYN